MLALAVPGTAFADAQPRIKDIVDVENVRPNQLVGYGLVVGLQGTGDRIRNVPFTEETLQAMLERMGVNIRGDQMLTQNVAAVTVTATMPPFARSGSTIDVQVSALGDATSLQGGILLVSSLRALDGEIYAVAQGPVAVSGFKAQGAAAKLSRGVMTTARIAGGGIVEREVPYDLRTAQNLKLALKNPDFTTAQRIAARINGEGSGSAEVLDPATVQITPRGGNVIEMVTRIENLTVPVDQPARIVINEAAGTVVMGADVRVSPVAIAQGGLTISVTESPIVSQPAPFSNGQTTTVPRTRVEANDGNGASLAMLTEGTSLRTLVSGLNSLGVSPRDLITILQALQSAGALQAEITVQ
ncbi:flagellar basal body P-ring protein FlgI [Novosphingobium sp. BL-8H]|uniref:flagellar basal body P-ring protein FlgI n=1 Tax=Novosphingobium sp. BL-8H TaxID=3127640 RepID=UPI00375745AF